MENTDNITDIDARIAVLKQEIRRLCRRRNELVPIRRLPNEIIAQIFRLLAFEANPKPKHRGSGPYVDYLSSMFKLYSSPGEIRSSVGWVRLMSSCTWLRAIALDDHELWRMEGNMIRIPGSNEWRELCAQRAQHLGQITLHCQLDPDYGSPYVGKSMLLLREKLPQVQEAYVSFLSPGIDDSDDEDFSYQVLLNLRSSMREACPQLQYLNFSWNRLSISRKLLDNSCNSLATLVLKQVKELDSWPDLPCLRNLMVEFRDLTEVPLETILGWLSSIQTLEVLALEGNGQVWGNIDDTQLVSPIHLPSLRIVRLQMCATAIVRLLRALPNPIIGLDINVRVDYDSTHILPGQIYGDIMHRMIAFWDKANPSLSTAPSRPLQLTLSCPIQMDSTESSVDGELILRDSLFPTTICRLSPNSRFCHFRGWYDYLVPLPHGIKLDTLHLLDPYRGKARVSTVAPSDPLLGQMDIHTVFWDLVEHFRQDQVNQLENWLANRKTHGKPIRVLKIRDSKIPKDSRLLRTMADTVGRMQVVDDVQWVEME